MSLKSSNKIKYSSKFTFIDFDILNSYNEDCHHPNTPWLCCCGCGLGGCKVKDYEDYYDGWDI